MNPPKLWGSVVEAAAELSITVEDLFREAVKRDLPKSAIGFGRQGRSQINLPKLRKWAKTKGLLR